MKTKFAVAPLAALALFAAGCADSPVAPSRALLPGDVSLAVSQQVINFRGGESYPTGTADGYIRLCKTGDAPGTFTFNLSVNGGTPFQVTRTLTTGSLTDCGTGPAYISTVAGNGFPQTVVITEVAQTDWALTNIDIVQVLASGIYNFGGTPPGNYLAPRLDDAFDVSQNRATVYINGDMARIVTFTNDYTPPPPPPPPGGEGCTPGYWKQSHHFDSYPAGYAPTTLFNTALGLPNPNSLWGATYTLLDALNANGGGKNALARHAAAAILNAASNGVAYDLTIADVQAAVLAALNDASLIEVKKNLLAANNEDGCPLN
jgi:hypothetical protein